MRLNTKIRYGVRAVFDIAYYAEGKCAQIKDISKRQKIPPRYLEQIFQKLKRAQIVRSRRGRSGGYFLVREPEKITIGDIIRATEGPIRLVFCNGFRKTPRFSIRPNCNLKSNCADKCITTPIWKELEDRISEFFDSISIKDLCQKGKKAGLESTKNGEAEFI